MAGKISESYKIVHVQAVAVFYIFVFCFWQKRDFSFSCGLECVDKTFTYILVSGTFMLRNIFIF